MMRWVGAGLGALAIAGCGLGEITPTEVVIVDHDADGNEILTRLVVLTVSPGPAHTWDGETVTLDEIEQRLVALKERDANMDSGIVTELRVDADPAADYADVARLMALLQEHTAEKIGFVGN